MNVKMTNEDKLIKTKLGSLNLAEQSGKVQPSNNQFILTSLNTRKPQKNGQVLSLL